MRIPGLIEDSTSSTRTTKPSFWLSPAESSPSAACKRPADGGELSFDIADHHVFDLEFGGRVDRVDVPGRRWGCNCVCCAHFCYLRPFQLDLIRLNDIRFNKYSGRRSDCSAPAER